MATLAELYTLRSNDALRNKIASAIAVAAHAVKNESTGSNLVNRKLWAKDAFSDPEGMANRMMWAILAANEAASVATITGAIDADIKAAVMAAIDIFATGT